MKKLLLIIFVVIQLIGWWLVWDADATITLTEPTDKTVVQRIGTVANIDISGTYDTGSGDCTSPTVIKYRITETDDTVIQDWQTLDASPSGGTFSGTASDVPQTTNSLWYNIDVRCDDSGTEVDYGANKIGVGIIIGYSGQSNAEKGYINGFPTANDLVSVSYTEAVDEEWVINDWASPTIGMGAVTMANAVAIATGLPVGVSAFAVGGQRISTFIDFDNPWYTVLEDQLNFTGGAIEFMVWNHGEADSKFQTGTATYAAGLDSFISEIRTDFTKGGSHTNIPFIVDVVGRYAGQSNREQATQDIRTAQKAVADSTSQYYIADTYVGPTKLTLELYDSIVHLSYDDAVNSGQYLYGTRIGQVINNILDSGTYTYSRGPQIDSATLVDSTHVNVIITHEGGSDFTPTSNIDWFEGFVNGAWETGTGERINGTTIQLTFTGIASQIRYLFGNLPDETSNSLSNYIVDNTALTLPLESSDSIAVYGTASFKDSNGDSILLKDSTGNLIILKDSNGNTL